MKQNVTDMKIADLVKVVLTKDLFVRLTEVFLYLLLLAGEKDASRV